MYWPMYFHVLKRVKLLRVKPHGAWTAHMTPALSQIRYGMALGRLSETLGQHVLRLAS